MTTPWRFVSVTDTAKLLRVALAKAFPGIKFHVQSRKYAGGASIDVKWIDGPLTKQVDEVIGPYKGATFDGMIDMQICNRAWLMPDGTVTFAGTPGTTGSMGYIEPVKNEAPGPGAELVRFGADYIHTSRDYSDAMYARAMQSVCRKWLIDLRDIRMETRASGWTRIANDYRVEGANEYLSTLVYQDLQRRVTVKAVAA